jgi:hypothetical protein
MNLPLPLTLLQCGEYRKVCDGGEYRPELAFIDEITLHVTTYIEGNLPAFLQQAIHLAKEANK